MGANVSQLDAGNASSSQQAEINVSQLDAGNASSAQQAEIDQQGPPPSPKPALGYQRLPPIESRETVQAQTAKVEAWALIDLDDDLQVSVKVHPPMISGPITTSPIAKRAPLPPSPPVSKKRRLLATPQALTIASQEASSAAETVDELWKQNRQRPRLEARMQSDPRSGPTNFTLYQDDDESSYPCDDEGYSSYVLSPPSDGKELTEDEREEQLVKRLATLQRPNIILAKPAATNDESGSSVQEYDEEYAVGEAREWMLREQQEAVDRSRMLRERNLARRQRAEPSENPVTTTAEVEERQQQQPASPTGEASIDGAFSDVFSAGEHQDSNMEELSDIPMRPILQKAKSSAKHGDTLKAHRNRADPDAINPASRIAAEQYRTQSRHLSTQQQQPLSSHPRGSSLEERESRLRELTTKVNDGTRNAVNNARSPRLNSQFSGDEFRSKPAPAGRATETPPAIRSVSTAKAPRETTATLQSARINPGSAAKRLSGLEMLSAKRGTGANPDKPRSTATPSGPKKGLTLPTKFDSYDEEEKQVIVEHEIAKERKRDLEMIERVTLAIAQLRCLGKFSDLDEKELLEVRKFMSIVIDDGKCAKLKRPRIQNIRDNMRRRAMGHDEPSEDDVAIWMRRVFRGSDLDVVKTKLGKIGEEVAELASLRHEFSAKRHNSRTREDKRRNRERKQVRFAQGQAQDPDTDTRSRSPSPARSRGHPQRGGNATESKRLAQYAQQDQLQEALTAKLKLFDKAAARQRSQAMGLPSGDASPLQHEQHAHSDSESEEDIGAQFVYGAGQDTPQRAPSAAPSALASAPAGPDFTATPSFPMPTQEAHLVQDIEEINRLEDARQIRSGTHALQRSTPQATTPGNQRFDPELLKRMQNKQVQEPREPATDPEKSIDLEESIDTAEVVVASSDVTDTDSSESSQDEDEDGDGHEDRQQVHKYTVMGAFAGIDIYKDADEYIFKSTYKPDSAKAFVGKVIESVLRQFPPAGGIDAGHWSLDVVYREGLVEQHLMVGEDGTVEARVWMEKKLVSLGNKAYRAAKTRNIVQHKFLFAVYWEKTVAPVTSTAEKDDEQHQEQHHVDPSPAEPPPQQDEADIDLFGEDLSEPVSVPMPMSVVSAIPTNEIQYFTTPVLANRHAKNIYMAWHATFLPGWRNEGYRRLEDDAVEQQLKALGSWGLWSREESFERAGEGSANARVEEKFKVWVRRIEVFGPGN
ncbi:hypothetical protein A1O3_06534 [Capronia epimyces CBS 606.96]|uniref:Uncharacterized protein n=1 Tax=Capronia epimyces CBS 606.96 TaxID=1182542 RepID=W9XZA4_9EURO|nr:uncharacterized protein A1O3_06534 [Capronia epimyces CBS 606.96]EXJ82720.1 hypothetical protein A1O3_06534 [Capronia epimyces CBS 606.96]